MAEKRILLADADPGALGPLIQALNDPSWEVRRAASSLATHRELELHSYEVLIADLDVPGPGGGAQLLNEVRQKYPQVLRFIAAPELQRKRVMQEVLGAHQFLIKPFERATLLDTLNQALEADRWIASPQLRTLAGRLTVFPTVPDLYLEVLDLLRAPATTTEEVGAVIAKDIAMMTRMLQIINSAYFGLPRKISDPAEAVGILGFETIKSMVMSIKVLNQFNQLKPLYFSVDHLWLHSTETARIARDLTVAQTQDRSLASEAYTAGLLHDLGKLVFAANFDQQYAKVYLQARQQQTSLHELEKEVFGASHGEIGAYLFGLWGLPMPILEAVAWHHTPGRSLATDFSPLTALHVANTFQYEIKADQEQLSLPPIDAAYLAQTGCAERLPGWREATLNHLPFSPASRETSAAAEATDSSEPSPHPALPARPVKPAAPRPTIRRRRDSLLAGWRFPAVALGLLLAVLGIVAWVYTHPKPGLSFDDLRLDGVIQTSGQAYAIINGQMVGLYGRIGGGTVEKIGRTNVVVQSGSRQRVLNLK